MLYVKEASNYDVIKMFIDNSFPKNKLPVWGTQNLKITKTLNGWSLVNYATPLLYRKNGENKIYYNADKYSVSTSKIQNDIKSALVNEDFKIVNEKQILDKING